MQLRGLQEKATEIDAPEESLPTFRLKTTLETFCYNTRVSKDKKKLFESYNLKIIDFTNYDKGTYLLKVSSGYNSISCESLFIILVNLYVCFCKVNVSYNIILIYIIYYLKIKIKKNINNYNFL